MNCKNKGCRYYGVDLLNNCEVFLDSEMEKYCKKYIPEAPSLKDKLEEAFYKPVVTDKLIATELEYVKTKELYELLSDIIDRVEK